MELIDVLTQAMKLETDGKDFYLEMAASLPDANVQQIFKQLADDEVNHYNYIQRQYEALRTGQGWAAIPEMAQAGVLDAVSLVFPPTKEALKELPAHPNEEDALLFAMGAEDKSFQLYYNSAQIASDPEAKKLFTQLAQAEHTHFNILMQRYESRYPYPR
jgi:rubrerythrin